MLYGARVTACALSIAKWNHSSDDEAPNLHPSEANISQIDNGRSCTLVHTLLALPPCAIYLTELITNAPLVDEFVGFADMAHSLAAVTVAALPTRIPARPLL